MYDSLIRVMLRLRPSDPDNYEDVYAVSSNNIDIQFFLPHREPEGFQFHRIFQPFSLQTDIYEQASLSQIDNFLRGQDSLVVAYGPKNSGKSYSLYGSLKIPNETNGLIPKAFIHIFKRMKDMRTRKEVSLVVSFMEIHANCIKDLGNSVSEDSNHMLEISNYDGPGHIDGLSVLLVESYQEVKTILETGLALRTQSKDGHLVLKLVMTAKENNEATNSYFYFVELAGIGNQRHDKVKYKELEFLNSSFISVKKAILGIQKGVHINHKESLLT